MKIYFDLFLKKKLCQYNQKVLFHWFQKLNLSYFITYSIHNIYTYRLMSSTDKRRFESLWNDISICCHVYFLSVFLRDFFFSFVIAYPKQKLEKKNSKSVKSNRWFVCARSKSNRDCLWCLQTEAAKSVCIWAMIFSSWNDFVFLEKSFPSKCSLIKWKHFKSTSIWISIFVLFLLCF